MSVARTPRATRGRPRDESHDVVIRNAVIRLLEQGSYAELSVAAVARAAGVGKPTVYLRWRSKAVLAADAVVQYMSTEPFPDSGDVRSDLIAGLAAMIVRLNAPPIARALPGLLADLRNDPQLGEEFRDRYFRPRRASIRAALERGVSRGELPGDADLELLIDQIVGPV